MTRLAARTGCLLLAAGIAAAGMPARSGEKTHRVRAGESASAIAKRYYGSYDAAPLLLRYNGRSGTLLRVGETLRVPYAEVHEVAPGDSWSGIAKGRMGRVSAYEALAALNGRAVDEPLQVGSRILIPVVFEHRLERGESLAALAARFYDDASLAGVVQSFNGIEDPRRLSVGQTVQVPVIALRLDGAGEPTAARTPPPAPVPETASSRPDVASPAPAPKKVATRPEASPPVPAKPEVTEAKVAADAPPAREATVDAAPAPPPRRFESELAAAAAAWREGRYESVRRDLEAVRARVEREGARADRVEMFRLLAFVYVAFDLDGEACAAWAGLTALEPEPRLDPDLVSPKIRATVARCSTAAVVSRASVGP